MTDRELDAAIEQLEAALRLAQARARAVEDQLRALQDERTRRRVAGRWGYPEEVA